MATATQVKAALAVTMAVAETIRELGRTPSGHLYAGLCDRISFASYEQIIGTLVNAGLIRKSGHELIWIGGGVK
jgi:hypothetical protein